MNRLGVSYRGKLEYNTTLFRSETPKLTRKRQSHLSVFYSRECVRKKAREFLLFRRVTNLPSHYSVGLYSLYGYQIALRVVLKRVNLIFLQLLPCTLREGHCRCALVDDRLEKQRFSIYQNENDDSNNSRHVSLIVLLFGRFNLATLLVLVDEQIYIGCSVLFVQLEHFLLCSVC